MTIPGIRYVEAGMILGEIGDIHRFPDYHKLLAYAGLDPVIRQSGKFNASRTIGYCSFLHHCLAFVKK